MERIKIATHQCLFGQEKWILKSLENCYPFVDKIYLSYSKLPWGYNRLARGSYENPLNLYLIKNSKYMDKIEIIYGDWMTEEDQRNSCVNKAKEDGFDYLLIQDTDEFYKDEDYAKIIDFINKNPNYDLYKVPWVCLWKNLDYCLTDRGENDIIGYPEIAINLKNNNRFVRCRVPEKTTNSVIIPDVLCFHCSYVLNDEECFLKINTWGHSHQFNHTSWFNDKWVNWTPETLNLHPISPGDWYKANKINRKLPNLLNYE